MNKIKQTKPVSHGLLARRSKLALAVALGFGLSGQVLAQSTTGTIFGQAPVAAGETVQITGGSGFNRTVPVDSTGRYSITVPVGTYDVTLLQGGTAIQTRKGVTPQVAGATAVDFVSSAAATAQNLSSVTVTANALPAIDVTSTNESTVITAEQLKHLPLARTGAAIALLAPGTVQGAGLLGNGPTREPLVSFGGASVAENAYYINGFNTSDPLGNAGGITLPYGSISQQQTLTSGYGAQYGRSAGGVISQVGMSGTNEFHAGGQVLWRPMFAQGTEANWHYSNPLSQTPGRELGNIYTYRNTNTQWNTVYDGYLSGPLIKDKLFLFVSAEASKSDVNSVQSIGASKIYYQKYDDPKYYAKLDWNITDSNTLSLTGVKNSDAYSATINNYNYANHSVGAFSSYDQSYKNSFGLWIAKYTSYITDDLTLNVMYGKMNGTYYTNQPVYPGYDPTLPNILGSSQQNPAYTAGSPGGITNTNTNSGEANPSHKSSVTNLRVDLEWKRGDHDVQFGIDNDTTRDINDGQIMTGPGYAWAYSQAPDSVTPIVGSIPSLAPYVGPTGPYPGGAQGYNVSKYIFVTSATVQVTQRAQYIQDNWQVTPRLLLNLGLRNDQFTNYNQHQVPYLRLTSPQWAPRVGFSWDVNGDSSLKIFGNAGRYYLAMPAGVALREAAGSLYTQQYYTYTGIDPNGIPLNLTPIASNPNGGVSNNNEYGQPLDPKTVASKNLKAEYQDEYVLGMQQQINSSWVYGVTGMVRRLGRIIDDTADTQTIYNAMIAQGANPATLKLSDINGSILINPGSSNTITAKNEAGGYNTAVVSPANFGFPPATRRYYALEGFLEHPWDGTWTGKLDYVFSRSYGTTEGPVQSNIGQGSSSVSATTQWDFGSLMQNSNGRQANDRRHVLKAYGTYQVAPEWTVSGVLTLASGTPISCLGFFGPGETDPTGYGANAGGAYHWCGGKPASPGSTGFTPWIHTLNLSAEYRPQWADKKLGFQVLVNNVFNEQKVTQVQPYYGSSTNPSPLYLRPAAMEIPRYVQMSVSYDW
ncbi:TonB-dependent receptor [Dyella silvatica]|uniref:TonB-dependent receptor n=1 Tax=Dyella silvatica TaxID=2992128 RepID=UPI00224CBBC3|nr:TonB-dependent receptor [Dyella silvatica]